MTRPPLSTNSAKVLPVKALPVKVLLGLVAPAFLLAGAASGDDVYLNNGQVFEDVLTEERGDRLVVQLEIGEIALPWSRIERVERKTTPRAEFETRRAALAARTSATAGAWLELADWAWQAELPEQARACVLGAAAVDPGAPALVPAMAKIDYLRDHESGQWVAHDVLMRLQGLVHYDGEWLDRSEARRRVAEAERSIQSATPEPALVAGGAANDRGQATAADVAVAQVELIRDVLEQQAEVEREEPVPRLPTPGLWYGGFRASGFGYGRPVDQEAWRALAIRQPGSAIGLDSYRNDR